MDPFKAPLTNKQSNPWPYRDTSIRIFRTAKPHMTAHLDLGSTRILWIHPSLEVQPCACVLTVRISPNQYLTITPSHVTGHNILVTFRLLQYYSDPVNINAYEPCVQYYTGWNTVYLPRKQRTVREVRSLVARDIFYFISSNYKGDVIDYRLLWISCWIYMAMMTPFQRCILLTRKYTARCFSSRRAILYSATGDPAQVLSVSKISPLPEAIPVGHVGVKFLLSPINPADLNVVQGKMVMLCASKHFSKLSCRRLSF